MNGTAAPAGLCALCGAYGGHATAPPCPLVLVQEHVQQLIGHLAASVCALQELYETIQALEAALAEKAAR